MTTNQPFLAINQHLTDFAPITLPEMESVKLMDRSEVKFTIPVVKLADILASVQDHYRILEMKDTRIFDYETLYFDTPSMDLYHQHHAGHLNRCKIRFRNYVDTNTSFFEIKLKNNKGRTIKTRIPDQLSELNEIGEQSSAFLETKTAYKSDQFQPAVWVFYSRLTLVSTCSAERITIDLNLRFRSGDKQKHFTQMAVVEVKQEKKHANSVFLDLMQKRRFKQSGMSKYCLGVASLFDQVKRNRFKPKLNFLNKINNFHATITASRPTQFV